jgi:glycosyltransferase involved in cell wall biosynthesis
MKIVYLSTSVFPSRSANAVHVMQMCQALAQNGHEVSLLARSSGVPFKSIPDLFVQYGVAPCFTLHIAPIPSVRVIGALAYQAYALAFAIYQQPDLIYARHVLNLAAVAHLNKPMVLELHDTPFNPREQRVIAQIFRCPNLVRIVTISTALARAYQQIYPDFPDKKTVVAHDGAVPATSSSMPAPIRPWPGRVGALQIGYTGHLYPGRGIELIIKLAGEFPENDFHLVGGAQTDLDYWRTTSSASNLYFHGFVPHSQIPNYLAGFDVVLAPYQQKVSTAGGRDTSGWMSPLKLFEYMAARQAIICSDLPVLREVLTNEETALLVLPDDSTAWRAAITKLRDDPVLREQLGRNAFELLTHKYAWSVRAANVLNDIR